MLGHFDRTSCGRGLRKTVAAVVVVCFMLTGLLPAGYAQGVMDLPRPGAMVLPSAAYMPVSLRAVKVYPDQPLVFDFIVDSGDTDANQALIKTETEKLVKYFLASLTIPEKDLWVNLSPYEHDRIVPEAFGQTEMGRDLLAQDYVLKQLTASLIYPEKDLGKEFWSRVYARVTQVLGTADLPTNTFNKVWIMPDQAKVYEVGDTAILGATRMKVMMEEDYLALKQNMKDPAAGMGQMNNADIRDAARSASDVMRQVVIPEIEKEINTGKNFALLRQVYQAMVLAMWYKNNLKDSLLGQVYADKNKVDGVDILDKTDKEKIYQRYIAAYKEGVFNYIKEDVDPVTQETLPRKYFSGGFQGTELAAKVRENAQKVDRAEKLPVQVRDAADAGHDLSSVKVAITQKPGKPEARPQTTFDRAATPQEQVEFVKSSNLPERAKVHFERSQVDAPERATLFFAAENGFGHLIDRWDDNDVAGQKEQLVKIEKIKMFYEKNNRHSQQIIQAAERHDISAIDRIYEEARVNELDGPKETKPALFLAKTENPPKPIDLTTMSVSDVQDVVGQYIENGITEEEARKLKVKEPFSFETQEKSDRNDAVFQAALKSGVLGVQYFVTNIKRASENSHIAYLEFMKQISQQYNGYVQIFLSVEESVKVLRGDGCGMTSAVQAVQNTMGYEFFKNANVNIITDGGTKDRGGPPTVKNGHIGNFPTANGSRYYLEVMKTILAVRSQMLHFGEGAQRRLVWAASDGTYNFVGGIKVGSRQISELKNDGNFGVTILGVPGQVFAPQDKQAVFQALDELVQANDGKEDGITENAVIKKSPALAAAIARIKKNKWHDLGENFADSNTGVQKLFQEKPTPVQMLFMLKKIDTNSIIPNAFLLVYTGDAFDQQQVAYKEGVMNGQSARIFPGSYFDLTVGKQYNPAFFATLSAEEQKFYTAVTKPVSVKEDKILVGQVNGFQDDGNVDRYIRGFHDKAKSMPGKETRIGRVQIDETIELVVPDGAHVILENVTIRNPDPTKRVKLILDGNSYLQNSKFIVPDNLHLKDFILQESDINMPLTAAPGIANVALQGVVVGNEEPTVWDISSNGWEKVSKLELYENEIIISLVHTGGPRFVNRSLIADYKGTSFADIIHGRFDEMAVTNPRLIIPASRESGVEPITMKNFLGQDGKTSVNSRDVQWTLNHVKMTAERQSLMREVRDNSATGGIDFDPAQLNLKVERTGAGMKVTVDPAELARIKADGVSGFRPVILNITPVKSLLPS